MSSYHEILEETHQLSYQSRLELAKELLAELKREDKSRLPASWQAEIKRRYRRLKNDNSQSMTWRKFMQLVK